MHLKSHKRTHSPKAGKGGDAKRGKDREEDIHTLHLIVSIKCLLPPVMHTLKTLIIFMHVCAGITSMEMETTAKGEAKRAVAATEAEA